MKKTIIIFLLFFSVFVLAGSTDAALTCSVNSGSCGGTAVFKMSELSNAHAEMPNEANYNYYVCCSGVAGLGTDCFADNHTVALRLSGATNAHVEKNTYSTAGYSDVCLSAPAGPTVTCTYLDEADCSSLGADYACLVSISGEKNAHTGDCTTDPYSTKVCCAVTNEIVVNTVDADPVEETWATLWGHLENDGGEPCDVGFDWGDVVVSENSVWLTEQANSGDYFFYTFDEGDLTKGKTYHFQAKARNSGGEGYGEDKTFITKPDGPTGLDAVAVSYDQIDLTWAKGEGAYDTMIRRKVGGYPTSITDGNPGCTANGLVAGESCSDIGLNPETIYYYRAWSRAFEEDLEKYSDDFAETSAITLSASVFDFAISLDPTNGQVYQGNQTLTTLTVDLTEGEAQEVSFSASVSPSESTISTSFDPLSCTPNPNCSSALTISTTADTPLSGYLITVQGVGGGKTHNTSYSLTVAAEGALINPPIVMTIADPTVEEDPENPGKYRATLNGYLESLGYDPAVCTNCQCIVWFDWGLTPAYGNSTDQISMTAIGPFTAIISNLDLDNYYFEARAKNGGSW